MAMLQGQSTYSHSSASGRNFKLKSQTDLNTYCHNSIVYLMTIKQTPVIPVNVTAGRSDSFRSVVYMFQGICIANLNVSSHGQLYSTGGMVRGRYVEWEHSKRWKRSADHAVVGVSQAELNL